MTISGPTSRPFIAEKMGLFTEDQWQVFSEQLMSQGAIVQDRIAQILSDFNVEPAATLLLSFAASKDRNIALTAREGLRSMSLQLVVTSAKRLASKGLLPTTKPLEYKSVNEILDAIEAKPLSSGSA